MPNWVSNTLTIQGPKDQVDYIKDKLNSPYTREHENWNMETKQMEMKTYYYSKPVFSFWNIIRPAEDMMEVYQMQEDPNEDKTVMFGGNNWYDWNVRNWGTKWDVAVSDDDKYPETELYEHKSDGEDQWLVYGFNTAWSPPIEAMIKLSQLVPNCVLTLEYKEETGWGGEAEFVNGEQTQDSSYGWKCYECDHEEDDTPYCETCEFDMCPSCGYGEPEDELREQCEEHHIKEEANA